MQRLMTIGFASIVVASAFVACGLEETVSCPELRVFAFKASTNEIPEGWKLEQPLFVSKSKERRRVDLEDLDRDGALEVYLWSKETSFSLNQKTELDLAEFPWIRWTWRPTELPVDSNLCRKDSNNQAVQVLVGFDTGEALNYVWDTIAGPGTHRSYRWPGTTEHVVALRSGPPTEDGLVREVRSLLEDYRTFFGSKRTPEKIKLIRVQTNSQHGGGPDRTSGGWFGTITLADALDRLGGEESMRQIEFRLCDDQ